jgi:hypothetical protein
MVAQHSQQPLPPEARQQAWIALWRDCLLRPHPSVFGPMAGTPESESLDQPDADEAGEERPSEAA